MANGAKERLVKEIVELKERYHKLDDFLWSTSFSKLPERQQDLIVPTRNFYVWLSRSLRAEIKILER